MLYAQIQKKGTGSTGTYHSAVPPRKVHDGIIGSIFEAVYRSMALVLIVSRTSPPRFPKFHVFPTGKNVSPVNWLNGDHCDPFPPPSYHEEEFGTAFLDHKELHGILLTTARGQQLPSAG